MPGQTIELDGWTFHRASLAYIDITPPGTRTAVEVINCWDYAEGAPEVPDTIAALRREARAWLDDLDDHTAAHYATEARGHDAIHARETAPTYWDAGAGLETPHETAARLQQSAHELNRALGAILAGALEQSDATLDRTGDPGDISPRDAIAALEDATAGVVAPADAWALLPDIITRPGDAIAAIALDTARQLDRYYANPDEDPSEW